MDSVRDFNGSNAGLVSGLTTYTYDSNGNMLSAANTVNTGQNKSFTYNLLNLPWVATIPSGTVTYVYDASGNKERKIDVLNGVTSYTEYIGGIQYDGMAPDTLDFIQTEEGKAVKQGNGVNFEYEYYLGDNLGNTRVTFGTIKGATHVYQQDDYYPFGLEISRGTITNPKNEYLYNKKELQEEVGEYDYGARFYDPIIARWTSVDPLAEKYRRWSVYNYGVDNPIRFIDPDGMEVINADKKVRDEAAKNVTSKALSALGYGAKGEAAGGKNDLKNAIKSFNKAEKTFEHTEKFISDMRKTDPNDFKTADNLTYTNKAGETKSVDVWVTTGNTGDHGSGQTKPASLTSDGDIGGNIIVTTLGWSAAPDALAHELGHAFDWAHDPLGYNKLNNAENGNHNCQDDLKNGIRDNPLSKTALEWQERFDNLKSNQ